MGYVGTPDILGYAGYAEICGICGVCGIGGIGGICGTDPLPEIGPAGLPFLVPPPPIYEDLRMRTANNQRAEKRMFILHLTC